MGGRDYVGVFACFVFILCNACCCFPPTNDSMSSRLLALSVLAWTVLLSSTPLRCFVSHFRPAGPSKQRVEQANLYALCFAISPEPSCERRPHISERYQLIGRIDEARLYLRTGAFGCLKSSKWDILSTAGRCAWDIVH